VRGDVEACKLEQRFTKPPSRSPIILEVAYGIVNGDTLLSGKGAEGMLGRILWLCSLALLAFASSARAETRECAPPELKCAFGHYLHSDQYLARYPSLEAPRVDRVHFCKAESDRHSAMNPRDTFLIATDRQCRRVFEGQYSTSSKVGQWKYYWPGGELQREVRYSSDGSRLSDQHFQEDGKALFLPIDVLYPKPDVLYPKPAEVNRNIWGAPSRTVTIRARKLMTTSHVHFNRPMVPLCRDSPEATFDLEPLITFFRDRKLQLAYNGITSRSVIFITAPAASAKTSNAEFYTFSLELGSCGPGDQERSCNASVAAYKRIGPIINGIVDYGAATYQDDDITFGLAERAGSIIKSPTIWCSWIPRDFQLPAFKLFGR
jgi:hypothetical protein